MKYFVLTYDPLSDTEPSVREFDEDAEAFQVLELETLENLGRDGVEVVLFYCDSEQTLRSANQRYFNPRASRMLRENPEVLRAGIKPFPFSLAGIVPGMTG